MNKITHSAEQTEQVGQALAAQLAQGEVVTLSGALGAGKTAFARGVLRGLGYEGRVTSPTFAICNEYPTARGRVLHFDLYRLTEPEALEEIGFEEAISQAALSLIEWSENAYGQLPSCYLRVHIAYGEQPDTRSITIEKRVEE